MSHLVGDAIFGHIPLLPWAGPTIGLGLDTGGTVETGRTRWGVLPFSPARAALAAGLGWILVVAPFLTR